VIAPVPGAVGGYGRRPFVIGRDGIAHPILCCAPF
jgi:hypothetical protein